MHARDRYLAVTVILLCAVLFCYGCEARVPDEPQGGLDTPLAKIDGKFITVGDMLEHPGAMDLVEELIYEELVKMKGAELGLSVSDQAVLDVMQPYVEQAGGRAAFLEQQRKMGMTYEKIIENGKLSLLQDAIVESMVQEPTYDEVVDFLDTEYGAKVLTKTADQLGKAVEDVTVEEAYDNAASMLRDMRKYKVLQDGTLHEVLPQGHEVVNLLLATAFDDPEGDAWVAASPEPVAPQEDTLTEGGDEGDSGDVDALQEGASENEHELELNGE